MMSRSDATQHSFEMRSNAATRRGLPEKLSKPEGAPCGIGVQFRANSTGALVVASILKGGPAFQTGKVEEHDVLAEVNGVDVYRKPPSQIGKMLVGKEGTSVRVVFLRHIIGNPIPDKIKVTFIRGEVRTFSCTPQCLKQLGSRC